MLTKLGAESRDEAAEYWRAYNGWRLRFSRLLGGIASVAPWKTVAGTAAILVAGTVGVVAMVMAGNGGNPGPIAGDVEPLTTSTATRTAASTATATQPSDRTLLLPDDPPLPPAPEPTTRVRLVNVDGSGEREVPVDALARYAWSPDGATMAEFSGEYGLVLVDVATGGRNQVYPHPVVQVAWRPDSQAIAVASHDAVRILSLAGGGRVDVRIAIERERRIPMRAWHFAWSRDGERFAANAFGEDIVVVRNESKRTLEGSFYGFAWAGGVELIAKEAVTETSEVTLVWLDTASLQRSRELPTEVQFARVTISPSGDWGVLTQYPGPGEATLTLIDFPTGQTTLLGAAPPVVGDLQVGPSGDRLLAYKEYCSEENALIAVDRTGASTQLATGFGYGEQFSPDGSNVAYVSEESLFVVAADGTGVPVRMATEVSGGIDWSPDGSEIAVRPPPEGGYSLCP